VRGELTRTRGRTLLRTTPSAAARGAAWAQSIPGPSEALPDEVEQFLEWVLIERNRPATTVRAYRCDLAKFVAFLGCHGYRIDQHMDKASARVVLRRYQVELADVLPNPRTRARALVALRQFLAYACDEGWTDLDLSRQVTLPRFVVGDPHPVPTAEVPALLAALPSVTLLDLRDRAMIHLLISTGCRISEALALNRGDVCLDGFRVLGKGGKHRTVYLTEAAFAAVQDYLNRRGPDPSPALLISLANKNQLKGRALANNRLTTDGARHALRALRQRFSADPELFALIEHLRTPHGARHTAATTLLEATNGDVRLVQEVLGHASLETLRVYTEITDHRKRAAYRRLSEYMREVAAESAPSATRATEPNVIPLRAPSN
jgi:integrase/recombinase XerD